MEWIDVFGFCKYRGKTGFVRVIAHKLPDGQAAKARKRKTRKAETVNLTVYCRKLVCTTLLIRQAKMIF